MKDDIKLPPLPKGDIGADTCPVMWVHTDQQMENYAREAIKAVLQSPEIQALRKDAERYRWLRDEEDDGGVCVVRIDYWCDEYIGQARCEVYGGEFLDKAIDAAMEKKT